MHGFYISHRSYSFLPLGVVIQAGKPNERRLGGRGGRHDLLDEVLALADADDLAGLRERGCLVHGVPSGGCEAVGPANSPEGDPPRGKG